MGVMIDDKLHSNEKFMALSGDAAKLWLVCLAWLRDNRPVRDYVLPRGVVIGLAAQHGLVKPHRLMDELVSRCFWHDTETGYEVHGAEQWDSRIGKSEAGRKGAETRWSANGKKMAEPSNADGKRMARAQGPVPDPVPVPVPESLAKQASTPKPPKGAMPKVEAESLSAVLATWNANSSPLPSLRKVPDRPGEVLTALRVVRDHFAGDEAACAAAIRRCARDEHYRANRFGVVAFSRHLSRWDGDDMAQSKPWAAPSNPLDMRLAKTLAGERA